MSSIFIEGAVPLRGEVFVSGAKNAAMPILVSSILHSEPVTIHNIPSITDVVNLLSILSRIGLEFTVIRPTKQGKSIKIQPGHNNGIHPEITEDTIRTTTLLTGPLLLKGGYAKISMPGGCKIGCRKIDLHCRALRMMGASITEGEDFIEGRSSQKLKGIDFTFPTISVGATEHILTTATLAEGTTILRNIAIEPEVIGLIDFLKKSGANIEFTDYRTLKIVGVSKLKSTEHSIIPDRIEALTYAIIAAITNGEIKVGNLDLKTIENLNSLLFIAGIDIQQDGHDSIICRKSQNNLNDIGTIVTGPFPGFPTDIQPVMAPLLCLTKERVAIRETIFEDRFRYLLELNKMGANNEIQSQNLAIINGIKHFKPAEVQSTDLRCAASLITAALASEGETIIRNIENADRGYSWIQGNLRNCGAKITRTS